MAPTLPPTSNNICYNLRQTSNTIGGGNSRSNNCKRKQHAKCMSVMLCCPGIYSLISVLVQPASVLELYIIGQNLFLAKLFEKQCQAPFPLLKATSIKRMPSRGQSHTQQHSRLPQRFPFVLPLSTTYTLVLISLCSQPKPQHFFQ